MNIYQKLIEVRKSAPYLKKDQDGYKFKYVSSSNTLGALREKMDGMNLLLVPRILRIKVSDHKTSKGGHEYFTEIWAHFTWVNAEKPEEKVKCPWYGQGLDSGEKGVGKAATYAEKYFLLKFFNIATDKDDPDANQQPRPQGGPEKPSEKPVDKDAMTTKQRGMLWAKMKEKEMSDAEAKEFFKNEMGDTPTKKGASVFIDEFDKRFDKFTEAKKGPPGASTNDELPF